MSVEQWALSIYNWSLSIEHWSCQEHSQVACSVLPVPPASFSHLPGRILQEIIHAGKFWNCPFLKICIVKNLCCFTLSCFATVSHLFTLFFILLPPGGTNTWNYMQVNLKSTNRIICQTNRLIEREISWTQGRPFLATLALHFGSVSHSVGRSFKLA